MTDTSRPLPLALCLVALFGATGALHAWTGAERAESFGLAAALHLVATAGWLGIAWLLVRGRVTPGFGVALLLATGLRLLALPVEPGLSDDFYRYLHEGHLVAEGHNPYLTAPADVSPELRGAYHERINNPEIPAAYPAAVQYALAAAAAAQPDAQLDPTPMPWALKAVFGLCDLLTFVALWFWLPRLGIPASRALIHGLCPLVVLEYTVEAHSDSLAILATVVALWLATLGRGVLLGAALAVATAGKYLPAVFLPHLRVAGMRTATNAWIAFAVVLVALYLPFVGDLGAMFTGTGEYVGRWRSNDSGFAGLMALLEWGLAVENGVVTTAFLEGYEIQRVAKVPLAALGLLVLGWGFFRQWSLSRMAAGFFLFFLACAPTVHPWYVGFLVPFLAVWPNPGWLAFTGTVYLSYHVLPPFLAAKARGEADLGAFWNEDPVWKAVEYAPFYVGFVWALCAALRSRRPPTTD